MEGSAALRVSRAVTRLTVHRPLKVPDRRVIRRAELGTFSACSKSITRAMILCPGWLSDYLWQMDPRIENAQFVSDTFHFKSAHGLYNFLKYILSVSVYQVYSLGKFVPGFKGPHKQIKMENISHFSKTIDLHFFKITSSTHEVKAGFDTH